MGERARHVVDLVVAFCVGIAVVLLNLTVTLNDEFRAYLARHSVFLVRDWMVYVLLGWMAVMLCLAFARWRRVSRRNAELEGIVSSTGPLHLLGTDGGKVAAAATR